MAEIIGVVGSILTFCQVASGIARQIKKLYKEPAEIDILLVQLRMFEEVVKEVEKINPFPLHGVLSDTRHRAKLLIVELNHFLTTQLLGQQGEPSRIRRKIWWKNRRRLLKLRDKLCEVRQALLDALNAYLVSSASRIESGLVAISGQLNCIQQSELSVRHNHATATQNSKTVEEFQIAASRESDPSRQYTGIVKYVDDVEKYYHRDNASTSDHVTIKEDQRTSPYTTLHRRAVDPMGSFETLASFRPEEYTAQDTSWRLTNLYVKEVSSTDFVTTIQCTILYPASHRAWKRLLLWLTITRDSSCWSFRACRSPVIKMRHPLPTVAELALQHFLHSEDSLEQDIGIEMFLGHQPTHAELPLSRIRRAPSSFPIGPYLRSVTTMLRHLGCPWYADRQIVRRPLNPKNCTNEFLAYCESNWVREVKFGAQKEMIDADLYTLQVFRSVSHNAVGVASFVGLVQDEDTMTANGFLCELPTKGRIIDILMEGNQSGHIISWHRCARWCKQIVQGVAEVHSKGLVVGTLGTFPCLGVAIDSDDNAKLFRRFSASFRHSEQDRAAVPPEYSQSQRDEPFFPASPVTDVYQLGLLLWRIAALKSRNTFNFCIVAGCNRIGKNSCLEAHACSAQLPCLGDQVPPYLQEVIGQCRLEDPEKRPPACELLGLFPDPIGEVESLSTSIPLRTLLLHPQTLHDAYGTLVACSVCFAITNPRYFHCHVCSSGDFDLCPSCFLDRGLHCGDETHLLLEVVRGGKGERYHTNIKQSGQRDVVTQYPST